MIFHVLFSSILFIAGNENDMNYYETPDILNGENDLNPIEGRHLPDDTVTTLYFLSTFLSIKKICYVP